MYKVDIYKANTNNTNKTYTITFEYNTRCDVLLVGGGGQGGCTDAGGGGAGGLVFIPRHRFTAGTYNIIVGAGGAAGGGGTEKAGNNGNDTIIQKSDGSTFLIAKGGGGGGTGYKIEIIPNIGGSGGGAGSGVGASNKRDGAISTQKNSSIVSGDSLTNGYGNKGGNNIDGAFGGGGGGGAGQQGNNNNGINPSIGGDGLAQVIFNDNTYNFKTLFELTTDKNNVNYVGQYISTDDNIYFGGGGGGGHFGGGTTNKAGGKGGGGTGTGSGAGYNALLNTGGGGGGGGAGSGAGGAGGSGVVIIRYNPVSYTSGTYSELDEDTKIITINEELTKFPTTFPDEDTISSVSERTSSSGNKSYYQTFRINESYYNVEFSSYSDQYINATPLYLFDGNTNNYFNEKEISVNNGGYFSSSAKNAYELSTGNYIGESSLYVKYYNGDSAPFNGIKGEWVLISFPYKFTLKQYGFIAKKGTINKAPGKWILYSMDMDTGIFEIDKNDDRLGDSNYNNANTYYKRTILGNKIKAGTYLFIFTGLSQSNINNNNDDDKYNLNFIEILLFGTNKEVKVIPYIGEVKQ